MQSPITIYTDGSCLGNPGPGGWAALLRSPEGEQILSGGEPDTTNNRMELTAALRALQALPAGSQVEFYTDSQYLRKGITEWLPGWQARGWKRKGGALANVELWQALAAAIKGHQIHWNWVKGHSTNRDNQRVDQLARQAMWKQK
ncbi:MAG: ribonuclease HI [Anaerolineales bacterium]|nr:ribonuclease HI [Anaerolineales bacterium]MCW5855650.1 ribonuclease HI [Anaerolineales bacterium]